VLDGLVKTACAFGARPAKPGEFSERAFLNGKLDLAQAEAIADLIAADSQKAARNAMHSLQGAFSAEIATLQAELTKLRVLVEAAIDFPDEDIEYLDAARVGDSLTLLENQVRAIRTEAQRGLVIQEGLDVVLAGAPNAGKSSLLNALAGYEAAIVTEIPGTTRDVIRQSLVIAGISMRFSDTAGLRDATDPIEQEGIRRTQGALAGADVVLHILDGTVSTNSPDPVLNTKAPILRVINKSDLMEVSPSFVRDAHLQQPVITLSAKTGDGIDSLRAALLHVAGIDSGESRFSARQRHLDGLDRTAAQLDAARHNLRAQAPPELIAEDLRLAQRALADITGHLSSDALLGEIFNNFCIGK
jgi:tRNA modification GTPase